MVRKRNSVTEVRALTTAFHPNTDMLTSEETITVTERGGVLQSPEYPKRYPRQTKMFWRLVSPPKTHILLEFNSLFGLEAPEQGGCR